MTTIARSWGGVRPTADEVDLGHEAFTRIREVILHGREIGWTDDESSFRWSQGGVAQRAWLEPARGALGGTTRRLQLRTPVLEGFSGSPDQLSTLSAVLSVPTLAGLVRSTDRPSRLELASSLDVSCGEVGVISRELSVSAHVQAAEARGLFPGSNELGLVGLRSPVDSSAALGRWLHQGTLIAPADAPSGWSSKQIAACAEDLKARTQGWVVRIPRGICATFPLGRADAARSILEVKSGVAHSSLGKGLSCVLTTPIPGGPLDAMAWNTAEVGPDGLGDALGGWWPTRSGYLAHYAFFPDALYHKSLMPRILLALIRRARECVVRG